MSTSWRLDVAPWELREHGFDDHGLGRTESLFALSNGHLGVRGNLDEGEPNKLPGTYLNGCYESYPMSYAEPAYGYPEFGELLLNVTDGKLIRLRVDDEPLDLRTGTLLSSERVLDFRAGTLRRSLRWRSPAGGQVAVASTRLVSFTQRNVMAIDYVVEAIDTEVRVLIHSELRANQQVEETSGNPALQQIVTEPLVPVRHHHGSGRNWLIHRTRQTDFRIAAAVEHRLDGVPVEMDTTMESADCLRTTVTAVLRSGEQIRITKFVAYSWSADRSSEALVDDNDAALSQAVRSGWDGLAAAQREYLDDFWADADVVVEGDPELQQAVRFGLFHLLQASARAEGSPIPGKGLTGTGYSGHAFWETEMFVLPVLTALVPQAAADAIRWRHATLPAAKERAATLRLKGASVPWRTISGQECSGYWPAGTAAAHVNAAVAAATVRQLKWTDDEDFGRNCALELLVETARMWQSLGYVGVDEQFHIDGVTGPDEYTALVNDNAYTNLMAARNLRAAARVAQRWRSEAAACAVTEDEITAWSAAAEAMAVPYDSHLGMPQQHRDSTDLERWDFDATAARSAYPLQEHYPYAELYRKQVLKQSDLVLALHWCGDQFSFEEKARAFAYYEELTIRDSSLSASTQAVVAAELGHLELAHTYLREAAHTDLDDLHHDTSDGLHMASLAGAWLALVCGLGGLRDYEERLALCPRLPSELTLLAFTLRWRQHRIHVRVEPDHVEYTLLPPAAREATSAKEPTVEMLHDGQPTRLEPGRLVRCDLSPAPEVTSTPRQPPGRPPGVGVPS